MPKTVVSPLIYEGHFEWILRFALNKKAKADHPECAGFQVHQNYIYYSNAYSKKEYTLDDMKKIRNDVVKKYEDLGLRRKKSKWNTTKT